MGGMRAMLWSTMRSSDSIMICSWVARLDLSFDCDWQVVCDVFMFKVKQALVRDRPTHNGHS